MHTGLPDKPTQLRGDFHCIFSDIKLEPQVNIFQCHPFAALTVFEGMNILN